MRTSILIIIILLFQLLNLESQVYIGDTEVDTNTVITGLDIPWEIQWGSDNQIWTTERFGRVSRIDPMTGVQDVVLDISEDVYQNGESGLLGLVLHPDFDTSPYVYLSYTYKPGSAIIEKVVRYEYNGDELVDEFILLDNIPGNSTHDGCRLILLQDNTILISTGDAQNQPAAQDILSLSGKILRLNLDGSIPADNPFQNNPVYSYGHRNAQGLYLAPNGYIYSSEHGPSTDDELNILEPGRNYGWPTVHGYCNLPEEQEFCDEYNVYEPLLAWTPTVATSDIVYYNHPAIPEWNNKILLTTLKNKRLYALKLNEDGNEIIDEDQYFNNWWGRLRDICIAPDGSVYLATNGPSWTNTEPFTHKIIRISNPEFVSVDESPNTNELSVQIYPNPSSDELKVSVSDHFIGQQINIYTLNGILIQQKKIDSILNIVDLSAFKGGVYLVAISNGKKNVYTQKLLIRNE